MYIVEIYQHNITPYEVVVNERWLFDLIFMLQNYERCLQFRVHGALGSPIPIENSMFSELNFTKWVMEFDYSL